MSNGFVEGAGVAVVDVALSCGAFVQGAAVAVVDLVGCVVSLLVAQLQRAAPDLRHCGILIDRIYRPDCGSADRPDVSMKILKLRQPV